MRHTSCSKLAKNCQAAVVASVKGVKGEASEQVAAVSCLEVPKLHAWPPRLDQKPPEISWMDAIIGGHVQTESCTRNLPAP